MKSFAIISTLVGAALAAPAIKQRQAPIPTVNFSVSNDFSGANAASSVLADGHPLRFLDAFHGTAIDKDGRIIATSLQTLNFVANSVCTVHNSAGNQVGNAINDGPGSVDLDGQQGAVETDVSDFTISCALKQ